MNNFFDDVGTKQVGAKKAKKRDPNFGNLIRNVFQTRNVNGNVYTKSAMARDYGVSVRWIRKLVNQEKK